MELVQHTAVLNYVGHDNDAALYMTELDKGTLMPIRLLLPVDSYNAFGRLEQLTVAIRPGNAFSDADIKFQTPPGGS